jgi:hypothetical protein
MKSSVSSASNALSLGEIQMDKSTTDARVDQIAQLALNYTKEFGRRTVDDEWAGTAFSEAYEGCLEYHVFKIALDSAADALIISTDMMGPVTVYEAT